jgi:hypothetical protein
MKKFIIMFFSFALIWGSADLVSAKVSEEGKIKKNIYATTEDILLMIISPKVENIIQEKYGQKMTWNVQKVARVDLIIDHTQKESDAWYEMKLAVDVSDPQMEKPEWKLDFIKLKIDMPNLLTHRGTVGSDEIKDIKVDLIDYQQIRDGKPQ